MQLTARYISDSFSDLNELLLQNWGPHPLGNLLSAAPLQPVEIQAHYCFYNIQCYDIQ